MPVLPAIATIFRHQSLPFIAGGKPIFPRHDRFTAMILPPPVRDEVTP